MHTGACAFFVEAKVAVGKNKATKASKATPAIDNWKGRVQRKVLVERGARFRCAIRCAHRKGAPDGKPTSNAESWESRSALATRHQRQPCRLFPRQANQRRHRETDRGDGTRPRIRAEDFNLAALSVSPGRLSGLAGIDKPADIVLGAEPVVEVTPVRMALLLPDVIGGLGDLWLLSVPLRRLPRTFRFQWGLILTQTHRGSSLRLNSCSLIENKRMAQVVEHSFRGPPDPARPVRKKNDRPPTCPGRCAAPSAFEPIHHSRVDLALKYAPEPTQSIRKWGRKLAAVTPSTAAFEGKATVPDIPSNRYRTMACSIDHLITWTWSLA